MARQIETDLESTLEMGVYEVPNRPPKPGVVRSNRTGIADFPRGANSPRGRSQAVLGGDSPGPVPAKLNGRSALRETVARQDAALNAIRAALAKLEGRS